MQECYQLTTRLGRRCSWILLMCYGDHGWPQTSCSHKSFPHFSLLLLFFCATSYPLQRVYRLRGDMGAVQAPHRGCRWSPRSRPVAARTGGPAAARRPGSPPHRAARAAGPPAPPRTAQRASASCAAAPRRPPRPLRGRHALPSPLRTPAAACGSAVLFTCLPPCTGSHDSLTLQDEHSLSQVDMRGLAFHYVMQ